MEAEAEAIEARAQRLLEAVPAWIWDGESLPVPVEDVVDSCYGLLVREVADLGAAPGAPALSPGESLSGLLLADRGEIWVNAAEARDWPGRRRFTIGHELGHWCLHRRDGERLFCRASMVEPPEPALASVAAERPPRPPFEEEADVFAAALLMPARLMRREYERDREFGRLCEGFGVSAKAMGRRLRQVIPVQSSRGQAGGSADG